MVRVRGKSNTALFIVLVFVLLSASFFTVFAIQKSNLISVFAILSNDEELANHPADLNKDWRIDSDELQKYSICKNTQCNSYMGREIPEEHYQNAFFITQENKDGNYHHINGKENCLVDACWQPDLV